MKILTTHSMVATVAAGLGAMTGTASAQAVAQAEPAQAAPDATAAAPAGSATAVPDQVQTPAPAATVAATVTNGPIPDTPANRAKYGAPMSHAGKKSQPAGN